MQLPSCLCTSATEPTTKNTTWNAGVCKIFKLSYDDMLHDILWKHLPHLWCLGFFAATNYQAVRPAGISASPNWRPRMDAWRKLQHIYQWCPLQQQHKDNLTGAGWFFFYLNLGNKIKELVILHVDNTFLYEAAGYVYIYIICINNIYLAFLLPRSVSTELRWSVPSTVT